MKVNVKGIYHLLQRILLRFERIRYCNTIPHKVKTMRLKETIKVAFILHDLALWKTEYLYKKMLTHARFEPFICITLSPEEKWSSSIKKYNRLINYLKKRQYRFIEIKSIRELNVDIVFYEKPYDFSYFRDLQARYCKSLIGYAPYGYNTLLTKQSYNTESILRSFQMYVENKDIDSVLKGLMKNHGKNIAVTGTPIMDMLLASKDEFRDPWKRQDARKKRIIWAPHFTIHQGLSWLNLSSFSMMSEFMLSMAEKYIDVAQFAFKPHPLLYTTLLKEWGETRTEEYYYKWDSLPNCQVETGEYVGLFKYSDAMIHDCGSFLIEYLYTEKPVLYIVRDKDYVTSLYNNFAREAFKQLYHGQSNTEVEDFILDVINGVDPKKEQRKIFKEQNLIPPNGKSACENIIDSILGQNGYK